MRRLFLSNDYYLKREIKESSAIYTILKSINGVRRLFSDKKNVTMHGTLFEEKNIRSLKKRSRCDGVELDDH